MNQLQIGRALITISLTQNLCLKLALVLAQVLAELAYCNLKIEFLLDIFQLKKKKNIYVYIVFAKYIRLISFIEIETRVQPTAARYFFCRHPITKLIRIYFKINPPSQKCYF